MPGRSNSAPWWRLCKCSEDQTQAQFQPEWCRSMSQHMTQQPRSHLHFLHVPWSNRHHLLSLCVMSSLENKPRRCFNLGPADHNGHDSMQGRGKIQIGVNYPCSSLGSSYTALCTVFHLGPVCLCRPPCFTWLHSLWHSSGFGLHQCHPTLQLPITWDYTHIASPSSPRTQLNLFINITIFIWRQRTWTRTDTGSVVLQSCTQRLMWKANIT